MSSNNLDPRIMTVEKLIKFLSQFPPETPVTGYCGDESTGYVTETSISYDEVSKDTHFSHDYRGKAVDIMGGI